MAASSIQSRPRSSYLIQGVMMPNVLLRLQPFADGEHANAVANDIRAAGEVKFVDAEGAEVTVNVGDVTVEEQSA